MKYNNFILRTAAAVMVAIIFIASSALAAGDIQNSGGITNTGTIKLAGSFTGIPASITGTVEYNNAGAQAIAASTYTNLTASGGTGDKTLSGATNVSGILTVNNGTKKLVLSGKVLTYSGTGALVKTNGDFDFTSGTVNYSANATQTVYGTTYQNLTMSGALADLTKSVGGNVTLTGTLTNDSHTTLDFGSNSFDGTGGSVTFANSGTLKSSGTVTLNPAASAAVSGTFDYAAVQTVAPAYYTNLTFTGAGVKTFTNGSTYYIAGTYTPGGAANVYGTSIMNYNKSADGQAIADVSYASLELSGGIKSWSIGSPRYISGNLILDAGAATTVTGGHNINVSGNVIVTSNLQTDSAIVFAASTSSVSGLGDIIGSVTRTHAYDHTNAYTFNNAATTMQFSADQSAQTISMNLTSGNPTGGLANHSIQRKYVPTYSGLSTGTVTVGLGYSASDTVSLTQAKLKMFDPTISRTTKIGINTNYTRNAASSSAYGSVVVSGLAFGSISSGGQLALDDRYNLYKSIAATADWNTASTWDENKVPSQYDDAEIATLGVTINAADSINSLVIDPSSSLTIASTTGASLFVRGSAVTNALTNNGTFNVGSAGFAGSLTINANGFDNEKTLNVTNSASTVTVNGTLSNGVSATLSNEGTITVQ